MVGQQLHQIGLVKWKERYQSIGLGVEKGREIEVTQKYGFKLNRLKQQAKDTPN